MKQYTNIIYNKHFTKYNIQSEMKYYSLNNKNHQVTFEEAVINGLAPDKGLYFPMEIPKLPQSFLDTIENLSNAEIAFEVIAEA